MILNDVVEKIKIDFLIFQRNYSTYNVSPSLIDTL